MQNNKMTISNLKNQQDPIKKNQTLLIKRKRPSVAYIPFTTKKKLLELTKNLEFGFLYNKKNDSKINWSVN